MSPPMTTSSMSQPMTTSSMNPPMPMSSPMTTPSTPSSMKSSSMGYSSAGKQQNSQTHIGLPNESEINGYVQRIKCATINSVLRDLSSKNIITEQQMMNYWNNTLIDKCEL